MLSEIFKAYDVRGIYGKDLTEDVAYKIGRAFVSFLKCKDAVVGYDMRVSSPKLSKAFMKGATEEGANAIDIGMVSTDALYFASGFLKSPGVMFTASHNPPSYNGIKFCKANAVPINEDTGLQQIKSIMEMEQYENTKKSKIFCVPEISDFCETNDKKIKIGKINKNKKIGKIIEKTFSRIMSSMSFLLLTKRR